MKDAAGGRESYDDFWQTIDEVRVNRTQASASARTAVVNLEFKRQEGPQLD